MNQISPVHPQAEDYLSALNSSQLVSWQHQRSNLGLLLGPLLKACGWQGDILALMDTLPIGRKLIQANDLLGVMSALGYTIAATRTQLSVIEDETLPALFLPDKPQGWLQGMILLEKSELGLIWEDGRSHERGNLTDQQGILYRFSRPSDAERELESLEAPQPTDWLENFRQRFNPLIWHAIWLSFIVHVFSLAMPLFSMAVYDRVIGARSVDTLVLLTAGVLGAFTVEMVIRWFRLRLATWIGTRSSLMITSALFERLLHLPAMLIEQASVSAQLARIRAFENVRDFITGPLFLSVLEAPFALLLLAVIGWLAGPAVLVPLSTMLAYGILVFSLRRHWHNEGRNSAHAAAQLQQQLSEITGNLKAIQLAGLGDRLQQRATTTARRSILAQAAFNHTSTLIQFTAALLTVVSIVVMTNWNLDRIWAGQMSGGALVATMILNWRLMNLMQTAFSAIPQLEQVYASITQVRQIMNMQAERHIEHNISARPTSSGKLQIQNVGLRYNRQADPVFMGLNADIKPGQIVAIYGTNGTGKSSVLKLLLGLYAPAIGSIRLDGTDYRQLDPRHLRRQIAYFPQVPELLPGTIAENLRHMNPMAPDHKLRQALMWSDAWDTIETLPQGINTVVSDGFPESLTARIVLARLYLCERPVILCDELPVQLLNSETGLRFRQYIEKCRSERTVIFVAQREDWIAIADQMIWLKADGKPITGRPNLKNKAVSSDPSTGAVT